MLVVSEKNDLYQIELFVFDSNCMQTNELKLV